MAAALARDDRIKAGLLNANRQQLVDVISDIQTDFAQISTYRGVRAQILDADRVILARSWDPAFFGEKGPHPLGPHVLEQKYAQGRFGVGNAGPGIIGFAPVMNGNDVMGLVSVTQGISSVVRVTRSDEIGEVKSSFNALLSSLSTALDEANTAVEQVAKGDFSAQMHGQYAGSLHELQTGINQAINDLSRTHTALVCDNKVNQMLARKLLESKGVRVDIANDGQQALDRLHETGPRHYDCVLMDLQMPVMDGYMATRHLRARPEFNALPIVAMTAHAMTEEIERCTALGMSGHVTKPIHPPTLYNTLKPLRRKAP